MRSTKVAVAFAAGIGLGCAAAPVVERAVTPAYAQNASNRRFEQFCSFRQMQLDFAPVLGEANADLKQKGEGGWELASASAMGANFVYCFRRPVP